MVLKWLLVPAMIRALELASSMVTKGFSRTRSCRSRENEGRVSMSAAVMVVRGPVAMDEFLTARVPVTTTSATAWPSVRSSS